MKYFGHLCKKSSYLVTLRSPSTIEQSSAQIFVLNLFSGEKVIIVSITNGTGGVNGVNGTPIIIIIIATSVTSKKSPNVYKSCPKMISLEK